MDSCDKSPSINCFKYHRWHSSHLILFFIKRVIFVCISDKTIKWIKNCEGYFIYLFLMSKDKFKFCNSLYTISKTNLFGTCWDLCWTKRAWRTKSMHIFSNSKYLVLVHLNCFEKNKIIIFKIYSNKILNIEMHI